VSAEAMAWAMQARTGSPAAKLILLAYADRAQADGTAAWCSAEDVSRFAECRPTSVRTLVKDLVDEGFLRPSPGSPGPGAPDRFDLAMDDATRIAWRDERL
jgi:hypothetical protein